MVQPSTMKLSEKNGEQARNLNIQVAYGGAPYFFLKLAASGREEQNKKDSPSGGRTHDIRITQMIHINPAGKI